MSLVIHLGETDSTNNYLKKLLQEQAVEEYTIVSTDFQTAGKGQRGNGWESEPEKNLLFSMLLYPVRVKANEQFIISQIVSSGVAKALGKYTSDISIKWPNDIYWQQKKICGILIENSLSGEEIKESIAGIGINLNQEDFRSNAPNPVSLKQITGVELDRQAILNEVCNNIELYYNCMLQENNEYIISAYKDLLFRREGFHLFNDNTKDFHARIKDVRPDGILVLETETGTERKFAFKEVKYVLS